MPRKESMSREVLSMINRNISYYGPGTRYQQRIREGYNGINELDKMCKLHDQFYNENKEY